MILASSHQRGMDRPSSWVKLRGGYNIVALMVLVLLLFRIRSNANDMKWNVVSEFVDDNKSLHNNNNNYRKHSPSVCTSLTNKTSSLDSIALHMATYSSASFNKTKHILSLSQFFYINLRVKIFTSVEQNMVRMLEGYGLNRSTNPSYHDNVITVETSFHGKFDSNFSKPRIIIQAEQLYFQTKNFKAYILKCFDSPNCLVIDFSDHNYLLAQQWSLNSGDRSMLLIPMMIQNRLVGHDNTMLPPQKGTEHTPLRIPPLKPIAQRQYDVVFFSLMTNRRNHLKATMETLHPEWNIRFGRNMREKNVVEAYLDAKICLTMHAFGNISGGEYHRLSDVAPMGCIPLMEEWSDKIGVDVYSTCGGVVFSREEDLISTAARLLENINSVEEERKMMKRVQWWSNDIDWRSLLTRVLDV